MLTAARPSNLHPSGRVLTNVRLEHTKTHTGRGSVSDLRFKVKWFLSLKAKKRKFAILLIKYNTKGSFYDGHDSEEAKVFSFFK